MIDGAHISEDNCSTKCTHVRLFPLNRYDHCTGRFKKKKRLESITLHLWSASLGFYLKFEYILAKTGGI